MERIRQAVEKARRDRADKVVPRSIEPVSDESVPKQAIGSTEPERASWEYKQTRTIPVSLGTCESNRMVAAIKGNPLQDTYRMLRTRVLQEMKANNWTTIAVTSPTPGSGKTLTSINLAITLARDPSHTALLMDADLRRPSVHKYFDYVPEFGINDYLNGLVQFNEVLFRPDLGRLTVLPGKESISDSADVLASAQITNLLKEVGSRYDDRIVVIDVAPVLTVDDALVLAPNVDCMLMVAESGVTTRDDLAKALELLQGANIVGTVLNKVNKKVSAPY